jgi:hypothetical protein
MFPVPVPVKNVIENVDRSGKTAENDEPVETQADELGIDESLRKDDAGEEDHVLGPLHGPHRDYQIQYPFHVG